MNVSLQGFLSNEDSHPLLMLYPISLLLEIVENVPSLAEECSALLVPCLLYYISNSDLTVFCVFGLGVCAMHGGAGFDPFCSRAVSVLLGAAGADAEAQRILALDSELDEDVVKENSYSSLFKISVFRSQVMQGAAPQMLQFCFQNMPLTNDVSEARSVHLLFVQLIVQKDPRLLGPSGRLENISEVGG
jgi:hypothetical protein